jgi:hypothetical protein
VLTHSWTLVVLRPAPQCSNTIAYTQKHVTPRSRRQNAVRRILESLEPQQQLRDDQLINHQLPNNRLGTKVSAQDEAGGVAVLMLTIARSFRND